MFKCQEALRIRKEHQSKYGHVILPDCLPSTSRYHFDCYKKLNVLGKTHRKILLEMTETLSPQSENKITRSSNKLDKTRREKIFPKSSMFRGKIKETVKKNQQKLVQAEIKNFEINIKQLTGWMMEKCCKKYQTLTLLQRKLDTMDFVGQNTKLKLERHQNESKKK